MHGRAAGRCLAALPVVYSFVTPYTSAFLSGSNVRNITVQDGCPVDLADHLAISYDRRALAYVLNALDPAHPVPVPCVSVVPGVGS